MKIFLLQPKTETTPQILQIVNEPNLQNVNPTTIITLGAIPTIKQQQHSQVLTQTTVISNPGIKTPILKDVNDERLQVNPTSFNQTSQPSLVVSVPLSQATVSGVNLPLTTTVNLAAIQSGIPTQSALFQQLSQNRDSVQSSKSPIVIQPQHLNHQNPIERQSPLIQQTSSPSPSTTHHISHPEHNSSSNSQSSISVVQSLSPAPQILQPQTISSASIIGPLDGSSGGGLGMKIAFEKQPNSRIAQLSQEDLPARRSR